jgi:two-component system sensor histidine kinase KdpD
MSRIERGMLKARVQGVDLLEVASAVADRVRRQYPDLVVRVAIDPAGSIVRADPVFLERVIANLMDNAARATRESGGALLEVEGRRMGPDTVLRVIDHGKGVPWNIREQLFYPFFQMEARHPRLGTGLGLPICKGFLSLMGGEIWVENTPGGGATFAFSIPTETSAAVHAHAVAGSAT